MYMKFVGILTMLLVATLFVAPAVSAFVPPSKPGSFGNPASYSTPAPAGNSFSPVTQWRNLDGINPKDPSSMAALASQIKNMNLVPSPQRPFGWTPYCNG